MEDEDKIVGYGCVIVPDLNEYQGFFINNDEVLWREANTTMLFAMASGVSPIGALQAVCVDAVLNKDWPRLGVTALALASLTKQYFFVIKASKEPEGTRSQMVELKARSVEDARREIETLPEVIALKGRLMDELRKTKQ